MSFDWVAFTETDTSFAAKVTIRQTGQFGFTSGAINRFKIDDFRNAVLHFDVAQRAVGIELTNDQKPGAMEIKKSQSNTYLRSKNFCDKYQIDYSKARRYDLSQEPKSGYLYFLLASAEESTDDTADELAEETATEGAEGNSDSLLDDL